MAYSRNTVVGIFENHNQAQKAVDDLRRAGFKEDQIGIVSHDTSSAGKGGTADQTATGSHAGTGAATGALAGAGIGAAWGIGVLAGLIPAIGPVIAGGTLAALLASAGLGAAAGTVGGMLIGMGVPKEEADYYESEFKAGRTIVTVKADNRYDEAANLMRQHGGHTQERTGEYKRANFAQTATPATPATATQATARSATATPATPQRADMTTGAEQKVQLREEELQVHKRPVQTGEVTVGKEVITEHKTVEVPVQREEVVIERRPASGQASSQEIGAGEQIRIPVSEEEVDVEKVAAVKEEVTVGKRKVKGTEKVSEDVRKEQVKVEEKGNPNVKDDQAADEKIQNKKVRK